MATWAIGDVHGCFHTLEALVDRLDLDFGRDRLWMVGDLVNRGPASLQVLRWARAQDDEMGDRFQVVLGNHDLHLIARQLGIARARSSDTLEAVLSATDGPDLVDWLRRRLLIHIERIGNADFVLVHAGLLPGWSPKDALGTGERLQQQLQGPNAECLLRREKEHETTSGPSAGEFHSRPNSGGQRASASTAALSAMTRTRMLDSNRTPHDYSGPPEEAPQHLQPWFAVEPRGCTGYTVVCGHWAALGLHLRPDLIALDSGCVWGGKLTAVRLDDRRVAEQRLVDRPQTVTESEAPRT